MSLISGIILLALSAILVAVSAHPKPVYTAVEEEDVRAQTVENIKNHIVHELAKTDLDPVVMMAFLAQAMAADSAQQSSSSCQPGECFYRTSTDLFMSDWSLNASTLFSIRQSCTPRKLYFRASLNINGSDKLQLTNLIEITTSSQLNRLGQLHRSLSEFNGNSIQEIWFNSPYPSPAKFAHSIDNTFSKLSPKPIISIARLVSYDEFNFRDFNMALFLEELFCLVKLAREGFTVRGWDLTGFEDSCKGSNECNNAEIDSLNNKFNRLIEGVIEILNTTAAISDTTINEFCPKPPTNKVLMAAEWAD